MIDIDYHTYEERNGNIMANKHHLEVLRQSNTDTWKVWILAHALLLPDLYSADLSGADLTGAYLDNVKGMDEARKVGIIGL